MPAFLAFLHHIAAFTLVAAVVLEFVLLKDELSLASARKLQVADLVLGAAAGVVLAVGLIRAIYFEKGAAYYLHSLPFLAKLALFVTVAVLSIYPTIEFLSWKRPLKEGQVPVVATDKMRRIRQIVHWELTGVVLIILCAVLMARGIGYFG